MFLRNAISFLATLAIVAWFAGDAAAQFQRSRQQTGALGATQVNALGGNTFGVQAGQFGAGQQQRFGGQQFGDSSPVATSLVSRADSKQFPARLMPCGKRFRTCRDANAAVLDSTSSSRASTKCEIAAKGVIGVVVGPIQCGSPSVLRLL